MYDGKANNIKYWFRSIRHLPGFLNIKVYKIINAINFLDVTMSQEMFQNIIKLSTLQTNYERCFEIKIIENTLIVFETRIVRV